MLESKLDYTLALGVDEPPDEMLDNQVFWANAGKDLGHPGKTDISTQPAPQHMCNWDENLSLSKISLANQDSTNPPIEYQYGDCFSFRGYSSPEDNVNDYDGQYAANCYPFDGWTDQGSAMGIWGEEITTSQNYIDYTQYHVNESTVGTTQAQNYSNIPLSSMNCIAATPDVQEMAPEITLQSIMADNIAYGPCTPCSKSLPDSFPLAVVEEGATRDLMPAVDDIRGSSAGIEPTTMIMSRQQIGQVEQISEPWRDPDTVKDATHNARKLGDQLRGWNKYQMDAIKETSSANWGRESQIKEH